MESMLLDVPVTRQHSLRADGIGVQCAEVTKVFRTGDSETHALRGVHLEVSKGELTLLVGPSGCGKTTLISIIAGLLQPTTGSVTVFGQPLSKLHGDALVNFRADNIGFVFQQYNLLPALTAAENAAVPLLVKGVNRKLAVDRAKEILAAVGLGDRLNSYPTQLSGGQQQRVAIARSLVHAPRLLVCDEPTAALDAKSGQTVMQLVREVGLDANRSVIIVTHDSRVFEYGDRIVHMDDGIVEKIETPHPQAHTLLAS